MDERLLEKAREFLRQRYPQVEAAAIDDLAAKMYEDLAAKYIVNAEGELQGRVQPAPMPDMLEKGRQGEFAAIAEAAGAPPRQPEGPQMVEPESMAAALRGLEMPTPGLDALTPEPASTWFGERAMEYRPERDGGLGPRLLSGDVPNALALNQQILGEQISAMGMQEQAVGDDISAAAALGSPPMGLSAPNAPLSALDKLAQDPTLGDGSNATWGLPGAMGQTDLENPQGFAGDLIEDQASLLEDAESTFSNNEIAGMITGGAGLAAAIGNSIADFRTTRALEKQLAASAAGDTVARQEGALGGARAQRNIMATSLGRRDISPALALRNAQMVGARAMSDIYGTAAIESARERRASEAKLAEMRKKRWNTMFSSLTQAGATAGSFLTAQGAAETGASKRNPGGRNDSGR